MSILWLLPVATGRLRIVRPREETDAAGYLSLPAGGLAGLTLDNYVNAWNQSEMARYLLNTAVIVVPTVIIVLFLASMMAFVVSRYSWRFNLVFLLLFTAANLLPPQVIITPLFRTLPAAAPARRPLRHRGPPQRPTASSTTRTSGSSPSTSPSSLGFVTFVMSNYMKTIPKELNEAAIVDGAWRVDHVLAGHHAADAPGAGGAGGAAVHVGLQRLLLGHRPDQDRHRRCPSPPR